jgi:hypothetical protein
MDEKVRHDRAVEAKDESDDREREERHRVPAIEVHGLRRTFDLRRPKLGPV